MKMREKTNRSRKDWRLVSVLVLLVSVSVGVLCVMMPLTFRRLPREEEMLLPFGHLMPLFLPVCRLKF
jgi:hypothetical protein